MAAESSLLDEYCEDRRSISGVLERSYGLEGSIEAKGLSFSFEPETPSDHPPESAVK
jgi:hypothetical protein